MFDVSVAQVAVLGIAGYFILGRNEALFLARGMGRLLGRSVVRMEHYRSILSTYVASDQVKNMHPELRDGFTKFSKLQNELRSASVNPIHTFQYALMNANENKTPSKESENVAQKVEPKLLVKTMATMRPETGQSFLGGSDILIRGIEHRRLVEEYEKTLNKNSQ